MRHNKYNGNLDAAQRQVKGILESLQFARLLEDAPNVIMILNTERQVIYLNRNPVDANEAVGNAAKGHLPGTCLGCINAEKGELGCGSSEFCKVCGFNIAISASQRGENGSSECNIALKNGASLTLSVTTKPFIHKGRHYIFCALEDISEKKRRQMLENIFLHDILNTASVLQGISETFEMIPPEKVRTMLGEVSTNIADEIQSYKLLSNAETHTLETNFSEVSLKTILNDVVKALRSIQRFAKRDIHIDCDENSSITTERTLLRQVLINLLKNALEAGNGIDGVSIAGKIDQHDNRAVFLVHNPEFIPEKDQLKLFQKSFSTKSRGRGWGTYSIKILTEKYLHGKVSFESGKEKGTTFRISIPPLTN